MAQTSTPTAVGFDAYTGNPDTHTYFRSPHGHVDACANYKDGDAYSRTSHINCYSHRNALHLRDLLSPLDVMNLPTLDKMVLDVRPTSMPKRSMANAFAAWTYSSSRRSQRPIR